MDLQLEGKVAFISGSTAGIGYSIAETLACEGVQVIINGRTQEAVDKAMEQLAAKSGTKISGFAGDLSSVENAEKLAAQYPEVDILVNNMGWYEAKNFEDITDEDWLYYFNFNVLSGIRLSKAYLPGMKKKDWGRIIYISSESGVQVPPDLIHYGVSKAAQLAVSRGLAESLAGTKITVNCVLPGPTRSRRVTELTEMVMKKTGQTFEETEKAFMDFARPTSLIRRHNTTEEVAAMVAFIASPLAASTTGAALRVEGGIIKSIS